MPVQHDNLSELKQSVRKYIMQLRRNLSCEERDTKSNIISDILFTKIDNLYTIYSKSEPVKPFTIALYCAMDDEVSLMPFIKRAEGKPWTLCFPCMIKPERERDTQVCAESARSCDNDQPDTNDRPCNSDQPGTNDRPCNSDQPGTNDRPCNSDRPGTNDPLDKNTNAQAIHNSTSRDTYQHDIRANKTHPPCAAAGKTYVFTEQQPKVRNQMRFVELNAISVEHKSLEFLAHPARAYTQAAIEQQIERDSYTTHTRWVQAEEFHAIVVPVVGFDDSNMRLGYGQGNYDEFLVQCSPNASIIGVAFKEQHVACVYPEPHDVALPDIIVS